MIFESTCIPSKFPKGPVVIAIPGPILPNEVIAPVKATEVFCSIIANNTVLIANVKI